MIANDAMWDEKSEGMAQVSRLAAHAAILHTITLFFVGRDLPKWIMKYFSTNCFSF